MPEHEILSPDARTASRWRPFTDRLDEGESADRLFPEIEHQVCKSLQKVLRAWKHRGVGLEALLDAAMNDSDTLTQLIKISGFCDFAKLIREVVTGNPVANREDLLRRWLDAVWERARGQIQLDRFESGSSEGLRGKVDQMLSRLARGLSREPSRIPRCPRRPRRNDPPDIDGFIGKNLLMRRLRP